MDAPEKKDHGHRFSVSSPSGVHIGIWSDGKIAADVQAERPGNTIEELVTYDLCLELVAAACERMVDQAVSMADGRDEACYIEDRMRDAIPDDAQAALAARDARIREAALREAARHAASATGDLELFNSILALMSKDKADG